MSISSVLSGLRSCSLVSVFFGLLFLLLCCSLDAVAQPPAGGTTVIPRVGETIDQYERRYFSLFTGIGDFSSARVEQQGGEVRFVIARENGMRDTSVSIPRSAFADLQTVIEYYEDFFIGTMPPVNWDGISGVISPNSPFGFDTLSLVVTTRTGTVRGMLLHAAAEYLAIVPDSLEQTWPRLHRHMVVMLPEDIMRVELAPSSRTIVSEIDLPVSGNDTVYRRDVAGLMASRAFFPLLPFPELHAIAARNIAGSRGRVPGETMLSVEEIDERMEPLPFTIAVGGGTMVIRKESEVGAVYFNSRTNPTTTVIPSAPYIALRAGYSLFGFISLGIGYMSYPELAIDEGDYQGVRSSSSYEAGGRILLARGRRTFIAPADRLEFSLGVWKLWRTVEIESKLASEFGRQYPNINPGMRMFRQSGTVDGVALTAAFGYRLRSFLSLEVEGRYSLYEDFRVRQSEIWSRDKTRFIVAAYEHHMLSLNSTDLLVWLRFHF